LLRVLQYVRSRAWVISRRFAGSLPIHRHAARRSAGLSAVADRIDLL